MRKLKNNELERISVADFKSEKKIIGKPYDFDIKSLIIISQYNIY